MNKIELREILFIVLISLTVFACSKQPSATLKVDIDGLSNREIVLSVLNYNKVEVVDTLTTNPKGQVKYKVVMSDDSPNFYYLSYNGKVIANLLLYPGEVIKVKTDSIGLTKK